MEPGLRNRRLCGGALMLALAGACSDGSSAQTPDASVDVLEIPAPVGSMPAFDGPVKAIAHAGSSWYVAGEFSQVSPYRAAGLIELGTDGKVRSCLGGFDGAVHALVRWQGFVFVGGEFSRFRGTPVGQLAKLNATTCELDTTFSAPGGFAGGSAVVFNGVNALAVSGDSVYAGGSFTTYRGASANAIAKLDATTGALDTTFSPPAANGFGGYAAIVYELVAAGDALLVGGYIEDYRGVARSALAIAKLNATDGSIDTTFSPPANNGFDCGPGCIATVDSRRSSRT